MGFFTDYLSDPFTREVLLEQSLQHARLVAIPMVVATVLGVALGVVAHRYRSLRPPVVNTVSTFLTIPSLALFSLLIGFVGIGDRPVIIALTMYALLPIVRNTLAGLSSVDGAIVESARGMGMSGRQRLWRIELPNAWPVILTGVRVSTQLTVGIAAIAAVIGGSGLGQEIYSQGIRRIGTSTAIYAIAGGTLAILVVALLFDALFRAIERVTVPEGIS